MLRNGILVLILTAAASASAAASPLLVGNLPSWRPADPSLLLATKPNPQALRDLQLANLQIGLPVSTFALDSLPFAASTTSQTPAAPAASTSFLMLPGTLLVLFRWLQPVFGPRSFNA